MDIKMKTAFGCYMLAVILLLVYGLGYLFGSEFMPYHSVAVGMAWADVNPSFRVLILALMKVTGGLCVTVSLTELALLAVPFRRGEAWAIYLVPAIAILACASSLNAMLYVASNTPASPPVASVLVAAAFIIAGFALSLLKSGIESR